MSDKIQGLGRILHAAVLSVFLVILGTAFAKAQTFSTAQGLSNSATNSSYPSMVVDSAGNINVAWVDTSGINFARQTTSSQSFAASVNIAGSVGAAFQPQMIVDPTGTIVEIAWAKLSSAAGAKTSNCNSVPVSCQYDVFVSQLVTTAQTQAFTTTQVSPAATPPVLADGPRLAFAGAGVDVVWGNTDTWISQSPDGVSFGAPIKLSTAAQDSGGPRVAVDNAGNIFVVWTDRLAEDQNQAGNYCTQPSGTTNQNGVVTIYNNTSGGNYYLNWTKTSTPPTPPSAANTRSLSNTDWKSVHTDASYPNGYYGCSYDNLQLFFDQHNNLHLLWADEAPIEDVLTSTATTTPPAQNGSPTFSFPIGTSSDEGAGAPNVATDPSGNFYVAYSSGPKAPAANEGIYFNRWDNGSTSFALPESSVLSAPGAISPAYPQVAVDANGNVNVVWEQADQPITASGGNTFHLFFAHSTDRGNTFPTIRPVQPITSAASVLCIPATPSGGTPPTTPETTTCGTVQMAVNANSTTNLNPDIAWVNNPGSSAGIDFSVANVAGTPPQDFSISVNSATPTAYSGETVTFTVSAQAISGFNSPITVGCNDFPEIGTAQGGTVRRSDYVCTATGPLNPGGSVTVNLAIPAQLPAGTYSFEINGTSGGTTQRVMASFTAAGPAGSVTPTSATINTGSSANFNVTLNPGPFTGNVTFQCAGQPSWIQCAFNPPSVTASSTSSSSSVLTVTVVSKPTASFLSPHSTLFVLRVLTLAGLCASLLLMMIPASRRGNVGAPILLRGIAVILLTFTFSLGLTSCGGATAPSSAATANNAAAGNGGGGGNTGGSGGSGGSSNPVTVNFNVQAQSGTATATLDSLTITAQ